MKNTILLFCLSLTITISNAQVVDGKVTKEYKKNFSTAIGAWYDQDFSKALILVQALVDEYPNNSYLKFVLGDCFIQSPSNKEKAIPFLEAAVDSIVDDMTYFDYENAKNTKAPFSAIKQLGIAYRINYEFEKALEEFKKYETLYGEQITEGEKKYIEREKEICRTATKLVNAPIKLK